MASDKPELFLHTRTGTFLSRFTDMASGVQAEWMEGDYQLSFTFTRDQEAGTGVELATMTDWFDNHLMYQVRAQYDGIEVWRGWIWEMELEAHGQRLKKSIDDMANVVRCEYRDENNDPALTDWFTNEESINLYGRKDRIVTANTESQAEAEARAATELRYSASPYRAPVVYAEVQSPRLSVTCVGAMVLANNSSLLIYSDGATLNGTGSDGETTYTQGEATTISEEIYRIVSEVEGRSGYLYPLSIDTTNDTATVAGVPNTQGAWDRLVELAAVATLNDDDEPETFYQLQITRDGGVIYLPFVETVLYHRYPPPRGVEWPDGDRPVWDARPGIIKSIDNPSGPALPDTWLSDRRYSYAERVVMTQGEPVADFQPRQRDAGDIFRLIEANMRWIERNEGD